MRNKPWPIIIIAILHILSPIGNILANCYLANVNLMMYVKAIFQPEEMISTLVFILPPIIGGVLIYLCKKWSYYLYLLLMIIPFVYSYYSWKSAPTAFLAFFLISFYLINIVVVGYFILPQVRNVYFDPKLRWWETKPRFQTEFEAEINWVEKSFKGQIKNISEGGIFIQTDVKINNHARIEMVFNHNSQKYQVFGEVVYCKSSSQPFGYGIQMLLKDSQVQPLKNLIRDLSEKGAIVSSRAPTDDNSFAQWLKKLILQRKGILPETEKSFKG